MPVILECDYVIFIYLGHLGWRDTNWNDPVDVASPKSTKASKEGVFVVQNHHHFLLTNFAETKYGYLKLDSHKIEDLIVLFQPV